MANMELDSYEFTFNPRRHGFSGSNPVRSRADMPTQSNNLSVDFGICDQDETFMLEWDWMPAAQYQTLFGKFVASQPAAGYAFNPRDWDGRTYKVEIVSFAARPLGFDRVDATMALKVLSRSPAA